MFQKDNERWNCTLYVHSTEGVCARGKRNVVGQTVDGRRKCKSEEIINPRKKYRAQTEI